VSKQKQSASENSVAVQSGGDTVVTVVVVTPQHMSEVLDQLAAQVTTYTAEAEGTKNQRTAQLSKKILEKFATGKDASPEAFVDPDFQYALSRAHHAYARSGEEAVADTLVGIIARRSMEKTRTRLALSLNIAVDTAAHLTANEFAALSLAFFFRYSRHDKLRNLQELGAMLQKAVAPLLPDITEVQSCYGYLATQSCASISLATFAFERALLINYPGLLSSGIDPAQA
jgi:mannitol-1-phosphate/altronate dehydrogenase